MLARRVRYGGNILGTEAIVHVGDFVTLTPTQVATGIGLRWAWITEMGGSQNWVYHPAFRIYIIGSTETKI